MSLFFLASFFSLFIKFYYPQEIKYVFHEKNNLIPYTSKNNDFVNISTKSKLLKNISKEVKYVKSNKTITRDFDNNALSDEVKISGVEIIDSKNKVSKKNHSIGATDLANISPTSLLCKSLESSEVSKTSISGVELISKKNVKDIINENYNFEYLVSVSKSLFDKSALSYHTNEPKDFSSDDNNVKPNNFESNQIKEQLAELAAQKQAEEEDRLLAEEQEKQRILDSTAKAEQLADQQESQRILDSAANAKQLAELAAQKQAEKEARLLAEEQEKQRILDSTAKAEQLAELAAQKQSEEEARLLAEQQESQRILDSAANAEQLAELAAQKQAEQEARLLAEQQENKRILDSTAKAEQSAELAAQKQAEEEARLLAEEQEIQRILDSAAKAEQLAELAAQKQAEEEAKFLAEQQENQLILDSAAKAEQLAELAAQKQAEEEAKFLAEQQENQLILDSTAKAEQLAELAAQKQAEEEARLLAEQQENQRILDSTAKAEQIAKLAAQKQAEEEARLLAEQQENQRILDSTAKAEQIAKLAAQKQAEEEAKLLAEQQESQRILDSAAKAEQQAELAHQKQAEENERANLIAEHKINKSNYVETNELYTAPKNVLNEYYTIKLTTVYSPMEGISFLNSVRDDDEVWKENAFHLYQDEYNSDLTNISIGKFSSLDEADIVISKLKNKGLTNAKPVRYTNKMSSGNSQYNAKPISKPTITKEKIIIDKVDKNDQIVANNELNEVEKITNKKDVIISETEPKELNPVVKNEAKVDVFDEISKEVNIEEDFFTVQLAAVSEITSDRINTVNLDKKNLFYQNISAGKYALNYRKFTNYKDAHEKAIELHSKGFKGAYVTKYNENRRTSVSSADLKSSNNSITIEKDLNQLGYRQLDTRMSGKYIQIGSYYNWDAHTYENAYKNLEYTIYYLVKNGNTVKFLVGPFIEKELFIELRKIKKTITDAFIKTI